MINETPQAATLYDLNGVAALAFAKAVETVRLSRGWPDLIEVRETWLAIPQVEKLFPDPDAITVEHVGRWLRLATDAGFL